jgi:hypothetical protein
LVFVVIFFIKSSVIFMPTSQHFFSIYKNSIST